MSHGWHVVNSLAVTDDVSLPTASCTASSARFYVVSW